jgi:hypothetical protein
VEEFKKYGTLLTEIQIGVTGPLVEGYPEHVPDEARELLERSKAEIERGKEQGRRFRNKLRVTVAREYLQKDDVVSAALLREIEADDPSTVPEWLSRAAQG